MIEPLVVIPLGDGGMRTLAGHRRAAAAVAAAVDAVAYLVRPDLAGADDSQLAAALAENIQREGLSPQEEARAYAQLSAFPGWSTGRIAQATGRDELSVRRPVVNRIDWLALHFLKCGNPIGGPFSRPLRELLQRLIAPASWSRPGLNASLETEGHHGATSLAAFQAFRSEYGVVDTSGVSSASGMA